MKRDRQAILDEFKGAITEIGANRTMAPKNPSNEGWNSACEMAMRVIGRYIEGRGLFQDAPPETK